MAKKPRMYLFYGPDSRASSLAFSEWAKLFKNKYGMATVYSLDADELSADRLSARLAEAVQGQALFPEPKLVIIRRLTSSEKGKSQPLTKAAVATLKSLEAQLDDEITVLIWEEKDLPEVHPLVTYVKEMEGAGKASARHFAMPTGVRLTSIIREHAERHGLSITDDAVRWLQERYALLEKNARLAKRAGAGEVLAEDDRSWWLYQLLESACLRAESGIVTLEAVRLGAESLVPAISPFDIAQAIARRDWKKVKALAWHYELASEGDGDYYNLYGVLRWQARKMVSPRDARLGAFLSELLAEIEIIAKNYPLEHGWLCDVMLERLVAFDRDGMKKPILQPRALWKAHLVR